VDTLRVLTDVLDKEEQANASTATKQWTKPVPVGTKARLQKCENADRHPANEDPDGRENNG